MRFKILFLLPVILFSIGVDSQEINAPTNARDPLALQGPKGIAQGRSVMVSTQTAQVTEAAILRLLLVGRFVVRQVAEHRSQAR